MRCHNFSIPGAPAVLYPSGHFADADGPVRGDVMVNISLPHDAFVFVGDGRETLLLRNEDEDDERFVDLRTGRTFTGGNPATHDFEKHLTKR